MMLSIIKGLLFRLIVVPFPSFFLMMITVANLPREFLRDTLHNSGLIPFQIIWISLSILITIHYFYKKPWRKAND